MTLLKRTQIIVGLVTFSLILIFYILVNTFLLTSYQHLEEKELAENMDRLQGVLANELHSLVTIGNDWGGWDDTYYFLSGSKPDYVADNLMDDTFTNLRLNFMVYLDTTGRVVYEKGFDLEEGTPAPVPETINQYLDPTGNRLSSHEVSGIIGLDGEAAFVAATPVKTSSGEGPSVGTLIIGRYLNAGEQEYLAAATRQELELQPFSGPADDFEGLKSAEGQQFFVRRDNSRLMTVLLPLADIDGQQSFAFSLELPRTVYRQGRLTGYTMVAAVSVTGLILALVIIFLLKRDILSRMLRLGSSLDEIGRRGDPSSRVPVEGEDELAQLGQHINGVIAALQQTDTELRENEEKFRRIFNQSPLGIVLFDAEGHPIEANRAYLDMFGISRVEEIKGISFAADPNISRDIIKKMHSNQTVRFEMEYDFDLVLAKGYYSTSKRGKCSLDWIITPLRITALTFSGFLGQIQNVTQRKEAESQLKYLSLYDTLTGLYNRACFEKEIRHLQHGEHNIIGVVMADVDGLKLVNDTFGHDAGDSLLMAASRVLQESFRQGDILARIGGDEFAVLLPGNDRQAAEKAGDRIREAVSRYNIVHRSPFPLSMSVGVSSGDITRIGIDELIKDADNNMYREKLHHNRSTRSEIVQTLMKALKARDMATEGHAERLQDFVEKLGRAAGVPDHAIPDLRLFAQFHDIGKVGVADNILFKPSRLTVDEALEMQRHCEIGFRIAQSSQDLAPISNLVLLHHEWWNGNGYPMKLKGEDIPLGCRILAIADAYDAMTNNRPYRKALSRAQALAELHKGAGIQFDPHLVAMFIELMENRIVDTA